MATLTERVKNFFKPVSTSDPKNSPIKKDSSVVRNDYVLNNLSEPDKNYSSNTGAFFDDEAGFYQYSRETEFSDLIKKQAEKIEKYRQVAQNSDVSNAIEEIVNEICVTYDDKDVFKLEFTEDLEVTDKLKDALSSAFDKVTIMSDVKKNIYDIVKRSYVDGQLVFLATYDEAGTKKGIKKLKMIDPKYLYFDAKENLYKYYEDADVIHSIYQSTNWKYSEKQRFSPEEIVRVDFGLYDGFLNLSYLEYAIKTANMLQTLEDLLIPLRFSRSVSRRVFNVDVGDLPSKRAEEVMQNIQKRFKYKKFYNSQTGEVSNQQHITSMVEDYWFANRSGGKGTTVDVLDETGNLGELNDILYFAKKLYRTMNVPTSRIDINPDGAGVDFSYNADSASIEDYRFYMFTNRLRKIYTSAYKELLKRQAVATGIMNENEWNKIENSIQISFTNENTFIEKMKIDKFSSAMDIYHNISEDIGKVLSLSDTLKLVFNMSEDEIEDTMRKIQKEKKNKLFKDFYASEDDGWGNSEEHEEHESDPEPETSDEPEDDTEDTEDDVENDNSDVQDNEKSTANDDEVTDSTDPKKK